MLRILIFSFYGLLFIVLPVFAVEDDNNHCENFEKDIRNNPDLNKQERIHKLSSDYLSKTFTWENDVLGGSDKHYTNGMKWSWTFNPCKMRYDWLEASLKSIVNFFEKQINPREDAKRRIIMGSSIGMNMYTPNNIEEEDRQEFDRPYAGWLYKGFQAQAINSIKVKGGNSREYWRDKSLYSLEVLIGVVGPYAFQEEVQRLVHRHITNSDDPQGWEHQVDNKLGLNANYLYRRHYHGEKVDWFRFTSHAGANLGNIANFVNVGGIIAIGNPVNDFPVSTIQPSKMLGVLPGKDEKYREWYVFLGADARYVFSNIFVEGSGASSHDIELENNVYDIFTGLSVASKKGDSKFTIKLIERSEEFTSNTPGTAGKHKFGQVSFESSF